MRTLSSIAAVVAFLFAVGASFSQAPEGPPKPGPEHQKLGAFVGSWTGKGEMKSGPLGPGGPMTWTESCEWFEGGFNVVCKSEGKGPMGPMKGIGIMGYKPDEKVYTHYGLDNSGWSGYSTGTVDGDTWTFRSKETVEGKTFQGRFVVKVVSPTRQTFSYEMSEDGSTWTRVMEGETIKGK